MEQITKLVQQIGNGGHIYLPKELVGQKVAVILVDKSIEEIKKEALDILEPYLEHIKGIYLYGSYVRGEQTPGSDIDILVVTDGKVRIKKKINEYDITSVSLEGIEKTINHTAVLLLPILKEAKPILNKGLIEEYRKKKLTKKNTKWYIETTESSLEIAGNWIEDKDIESMPYIVYPLVMRLKGLYLIESLIKGRKYFKKDFLDYLVKKSLSSDKVKQIYRMYSEDRDKKKISSNTLTYDDISKLHKIAYNYFKKVRLLWEKLK